MAGVEFESNPVHSAETVRDNFKALAVKSRELSTSLPDVDTFLVTNFRSLHRLSPTQLCLLRRQMEYHRKLVANNFVVTELCVPDCDDKCGNDEIYSHIQYNWDKETGRLV